MTETDKDLEAATAKIKARLKSDELRVATCAKTFWQKYGIYICLAVGLIAGFLLGHL